MSHKLDLADIQGNILNAYGRQGFPKARYFLLNVRIPAGGRAFVDTVRRRVQTAAPWRSRLHSAGAGEKPKVAINIAFTFRGLLALGLSTRTLRGFPDEFMDGMARRAHVLGDEFPTNDLSNWDPVWQPNGDQSQVHILVTMNAQMTAVGTPVPELNQATRWLKGLCDSSAGAVRLLSGHRGDHEEYQDASALLAKVGDGTYQPTPKEHFGFTDGLGDPVFEGQYPTDVERVKVVGNGKLTGAQSWVPLATGEFLLGYPDEAQEIAGTPMPLEFSRNGTFMSYRKLHENVVAFHKYIEKTAETYARVIDAPPDQAREILMAKIAGRWSDGVPLMAAPTYANWTAFKDKQAAAQKAGDKKTLAELTAQLFDFKYGDDLDGTKCPFSSHLRRAITRDMLDPTLSSPNPKDRNGSVLNNRRRILRRGLPYGAVPPGATDDSGEHGIVMLVVCSSLFRQFEFVQQQWIQYGLDMNSGNDTCPLVGNHGPDAKFVIAADPASGHPPFVCDRLPQFVETRGGDYFFVPGMTALRMIGMGITDPT
jgi:deferrochelatase/peroxidase EfeB